MAATLQIDDTEFRESLNALAGLIGKAEVVLKREAEMLLREVVRKTPPPNLLQGREKLKADLRKVFMPLDVADFRTARKASRSKYEEQRGTLWITKNGNRFFTSQDKLQLNAGPSDFKRIHQAHRNQYGRTSGLGRRVEKRGEKAFFVNRYAVKRSKFRQYERQKLKNVGMMRSGFLPAFEQLGISAPNWWKQAFKPRNGRCVAMLKGTSPFIEITNTTPGIEREVGRAFKQAIKNRAYRMRKNFERMLNFGPGKSGDYGYGSA